MEENLILICLTTIAAITWSFLERRQNKRLNSLLSTTNSNEIRKINNHLTLKKKKWYYRGEGNSYISISLPETRQILRIQKIAHPVGVQENAYAFLCKYTKLGGRVEVRAKIEEKLNLDYYHLFIRLLGECYVQPATEILLDRQELWEIDRLIEPLRPKNRTKKHLAFACGSLLADYAYFPISWDLDCFDPAFSIEIKPKHGWISPAERTFPMCTFCLNQYIKLKNNEVSEISQYCPLDLFSGNIPRMKTAIKNLLNAPQNNLKLFRNGILLYGDKYDEKRKQDALSRMFPGQNVDRIEKFCDIVSKALLANLWKEQQCPNVTFGDDLKTYQNTWKDSSTKICRFENNLNFGCVLERILNLQRLDEWGSKYVLSLLEKCSDSFVENSLNYKTYGPFCQLLHDSSPESVINRYLMSAVAKDCSLMITMKRMSEYFRFVPERNVLMTENGEKYVFQIGVFDLYPKKIRTIRKHVEKRSLLMQAYEKLCASS